MFAKPCIDRKVFAILNSSFFFALSLAIFLPWSTAKAGANDMEQVEVRQEQVEALIGALSSEDANARLSAAVFMGNLADEARTRFAQQADDILISLREAGPLLARLVHDPEPQVRLAAVASLGRTHAAGEVIGPALERVMKEGDVELRIAAAQSVASHVGRSVEQLRNVIRIGERPKRLAVFIADATALLPPLRSAVNDQESKVQSVALQSLLKLIEAFARTQEISSLDIAEGDETSIQTIRQLLPGLTQGFMALTPSLTDRLGTADLESAASAAHVLEAMANLTREHTVSDVTRGRLLKADFAEEGRQAADALADELEKAIPSLAAALSGRKPEVQLAILDSLEAMNSRAKLALPAIIQVLNSPNPFVRWSAARILGKIGAGDSPEVVHELARLVDDPDVDVRLVACDALERIGEEAAPAVGQLSRALTSQDPDLQVAATEALEAIGPGAQEAVPALMTAAKSADVRVRRQVPQLLGKLGSAAEPAIPVLRAMLDDSDLEARQAAAEALLKIRGFSVGR